jgi:MoaA/NifB/PqqE/SkfB family radical SAM enzyme
MRIRQQGEYKSFFTNTFKTIRLTSGIPNTPELTDVAINDKCLAACPYCYTNALKSGKNFDHIVQKAEEIWGGLTLNDREFQIAIGGAGEPTLHPDFIPFIKKVRELEIIPNYTTNGMHLTDDILRATEEYCGGVALSWHPHIMKVFEKAANNLKKIKTKLNFHIIIGSDESLTHLKTLYETYKDYVEYFVILPYQAVGRGTNINTHENWLKCFEWISQKPFERQRQFAFGALFYDFLLQNNVPLEMSIYNPDVYSGYRILNHNYKIIYKSSYDLTEKNTIRNFS